MGKDNLLQAFASLKTDAGAMTKLIKKSFKNDDSTHQMRIFFKKIKAHIVLVHALGSENVQMSDVLRDYYKQIGLLRDAKIFRALCKKHTHTNKLIMVLGEERVVQAKELIKKYKHTIHVKLLAKEVEQLTVQIISSINSFDAKWVEAGLETFLENTENLLQQLLESETITNIGFHTIRKHIKKTMYLLNYMRLFDKIKYTPILKKYTSLAEDLGAWNDLQLLVDQLEAMPWTGKEEKIVKKLFEKEQKLKKKLIKKLRTYFRVSPKQTSKNTQRMSASPKELLTQVAEEKASAEPIVHKTVIKKPVVKTSMATKRIAPKTSVDNTLGEAKNTTETALPPTKKTPVKKKIASPAKKRVATKTNVSTGNPSKTTSAIQKKKTPSRRKKPAIRKKPGSSSTKK